MPALALLLVAACAPSAATLPAITPEPAGPHMPGKFVWRDLITTDLPTAQRFYADLFGWEYLNSGMDGYVTAVLDGRLVAGLAAADQVRGDVNVSQWISSVSVFSVEETARRAREFGAVIHREPQDAGERGRVAVVSDPQGALFAVVRTPGGDPPDREPAFNEWLWTELWTDDLDASVEFYGRILGYTRATLEAQVLSRGYVAFERDGAPRAGLIQYEVEGVRPNWVAYVRVEDVEVTARRAEELGGRVLIPPQDELREGTVALIADPTGAALAIQEWTYGEGDPR
jgi:predicted enzyme related to lactoylglutathione lyase